MRMQGSDFLAAVLHAWPREGITGGKGLSSTLYQRCADQQKAMHHIVYKLSVHRFGHYILSNTSIHTIHSRNLFDLKCHKCSYICDKRSYLESLEHD